MRCGPRGISSRCDGPGTGAGFDRDGDATPQLAIMRTRKVISLMDGAVGLGSRLNICPV